MTPMRTGSEPVLRAFFLCFAFAMNVSFWIAESGIEHNGFQDVLSALLAQIARRSCRLMTKDHEPAFTRRLRNPFLFIFERRKRVQIVTHDPGIRQMCRGWDQVGRKEHGLAATGEDRKSVV